MSPGPSIHKTELPGFLPRVREAAQEVEKYRKQIADFLKVDVRSDIEYWYEGDEPLLTESVKLNQHAEIEPSGHNSSDFINTAFNHVLSPASTKALHSMLTERLYDAICRLLHRHTCSLLCLRYFYLHKLTYLPAGIWKLPDIRMRFICLRRLKPRVQMDLVSRERVGNSE
jgi:hypothetical protein